MKNYICVSVSAILLNDFDSEISYTKQLGNKEQNQNWINAILAKHPDYFPFKLIFNFVLT